MSKKPDFVTIQLTAAAAALVGTGALTVTGPKTMTFKAGQQEEVPKRAYWDRWLSKLRVGKKRVPAFEVVPAAAAAKPAAATTAASPAASAQLNASAPAPASAPAANAAAPASTQAQAAPAASATTSNSAPGTGGK